MLRFRDCPRTIIRISTKSVVVMNDLDASYTDGSRGAILNIHEGTLCAAQYTADDAWYRAKVTRKTGPDSFEVVFVDYGNSEVLSEQR